jgi:hypothetical protein
MSARDRNLPEGAILVTGHRAGRAKYEQVRGPVATFSPDRPEVGMCQRVPHVNRPEVTDKMILAGTHELAGYSEMFEDHSSLVERTFLAMLDASDEGNSPSLL